MCAYVDLDRLIAEAPLTALELRVVKGLMEGLGVTEMANLYGDTRQAYGGYLRRAVAKIVKRSKVQWAQSHGEVKAAENRRYCL